jgi:hypothetical protein
MDADDWANWDRRYMKKLTALRRYIPALFEGIQIPEKIEQIALLVFASKKSHPMPGSGRTDDLGRIPWADPRWTRRYRDRQISHTRTVSDHPDVSVCLALLQNVFDVLARSRDVTRACTGAATRIWQ